MIQLDDLRVDLERTPVVKGVSTAISTGGWHALLGPNGSGKTTVLRAIAGLIPYRGTITVDGATPKARDRARLIAYVPQAPTLPPDMLVSEYVLLGRTPYLRYLAGPGRHDHEVSRNAIERLDLAEFARRRLGTLSGGEVQRVVLARALAQEPRTMLLDEPTSSLDIGHQQHVLELIDELRTSGGLTVVSTLHDLTTASQYAHQLVLLDHGQVAAQGTPGEVLTAERIAEIYDARVHVATDESGHTIVTPARPLAM
ncbi:MAG TPA: ABC transporter ATP-binding protein [Streptosporangiaceae bacterium]|nr:ABC transporter ATP-binding protein [Streptosporangiaceae bacterium]